MAEPTTALIDSLPPPAIVTLDVMLPRA